MPKINILHLLDARPNALCGVEKNLVYFLEQSDKEQFENIIVYPEDGYLKKYFFISGIKWYPLKITRKLDWSGLIFLKRVIDKHQIDFVHTYSYNLDFTGYLLNLITNKPHIIGRQVDLSWCYFWGSFKSKVYQAVDKKVLHKAAKVIVCCQIGTTRLVEDYGLPKGKVALIYNGVDFRKYENLPGINDDARAASNEKVIAIAVKEKYEPGLWLDAGTLNDFSPEVKVVRTASWELPDNRYQRLFSGDSGTVKKGILSLCSELFLIPDRQMPWFPFALVSGWSLIRREKIKLIFATTPPHSAQLIALTLAKLSGLPLFADLRDDWVGNPYYSRRTAWRNRLEEKLEKKLIESARRVFLPTKGSVAFYQNKYENNSDKFVFLTNGYDESDFSFLPEGRVQSADKFVIGYMGQLHRKHSPDVFFQALKKLIAQEGIEEQRLEVLVLGAVSPEKELLIKELNLENIVKIGGVIKHQQALKRLSGVTVTLLIQNRRDGVNAIAGKVYEYLRLRKPIIALTDTQGLADLISYTASGLVAENCLESAVSVLSQFYRIWKEGRLAERFKFLHLEEFNRQNSVGRLAEIFNEFQN